MLIGLSADAPLEELVLDEDEEPEEPDEDEDEDEEPLTVVMPPMSRQPGSHQKRTTDEILYSHCSKVGRE